MPYFATCATPDEARAEYRRLAKRNHPDTGGDNETMKAINLAYEDILKRFDGREFIRRQPAEDGRTTWQYHYNEKLEREIMEAIGRVTKAIAESNRAIDCTIVGSWLWVTGDTRPARGLLKSAGLWWNAKRKAWNWHPRGWNSRYNDHMTLEDILEQGTRINRTDKGMMQS